VRHEPPYDELLERHKPQLMYDSSEQFFADAAESALGDGCVDLKRRRPDGADEMLVSSAGLTLDTLAAVYEGGLGRARDDDYLSCRDSDYRALSQRMHQDPKLRNVLYGRGVVGASDGRLWLQYWLYYFFNDYSMAGGLGLHEGDWELVQLRMQEDHDEGPDVAIYAQHKHAERREWQHVETVKGAGVRPVVYVACGSHASYFQQGRHRAGVLWWDVSDGERGSPPDARVEVLDDRALPGWIEWPGVWGGTRARFPPAEQPSPPGPRGPSVKNRPHWADPAAIDYRDHVVETDPDPAKPSVAVERRGARVIVDYDFRRLLGTDDAPERMTVTVNTKQAPGETPRIPPTVYTLAIEHTSRGTLHIEAGLDPDRDYEVSVRLITADGEPSGAHQELLSRESARGGHIWDRFMKRIRNAFARTGS
jgi:hypothetical protein